MKIINKKLINYFLENIEETSINNIEHFLNFFYNELLESINYTNNIINKSLIKNSITIPKNFNIIVNTSFISKKIKKYIEKNTECYYTFSFKIFSTDIKLHFAIYKNDDLIKLQDNLYLMICWLYIAIKYKTKNCSNFLNVYMFLTDFKKCLTDDTILTPKNCNSGFTYACSLDNTICIFRKEEIVKVFIHETFHSFGLDFSYKRKDVKKKMNKYFNIISTFNISETYTETWATIVNCLFFSYFKLKKYNKDEFYQTSKILLTLERNFCIYQSIKILNHMGLKYRDILTKKNDNCKYKEKTNVFSYYILKSLLLINISKFLNLCKKNKYFNIKKQNSFLDLILKIYNSKIVLHNYNNFENNSINYNNSLKMTLSE